MAKLMNLCYHDDKRTEWMEPFHGNEGLVLQIGHTYKFKDDLDVEILKKIYYKYENLVNSFENSGMLVITEDELGLGIIKEEVVFAITYNTNILIPENNVEVEDANMLPYGKWLNQTTEEEIETPTFTIEYIQTGINLQDLVPLFECEIPSNE